jgi:3-phosphoshikimate 1-carboxyvinyltransferase
MVNLKKLKEIEIKNLPRPIKPQKKKKKNNLLSTGYKSQPQRNKENKVLKGLSICQPCHFKLTADTFCTKKNNIERMAYTISWGSSNLSGRISLAGSKSISNRALIIRALCDHDFTIDRLANAKDTELLQALLQQKGEVFDAGAAGTTYRFMTAYLATQKGSQILTGSERMKQRPIGVLVEALKILGANIDYQGQEGYPPLKINESEQFGQQNRLSIPAHTSSQYISALLMIAPTLPQGLILTLEGKIVSRPYIEMTLKLMKYFGVDHQWVDNQISISPQQYQARAFTVEADWSAASYYYGMAAFADTVDLQLDGLFEESTQGDAVLAKMMEAFGIKTTYHTEGIRLSKAAPFTPDSFEWDFIKCPDLAQTLAVCCAGLGTRGRFTGLETLRIKETDRIAALQTELAKVGATLTEDEHQQGYFLTSGKAIIPTSPPAFDTYEDHRMAMAFAPLAMKGAIEINDPMVVVKSYPQFWEDLEMLGFEVVD